MSTSITSDAIGQILNTYKNYSHTYPSSILHFPLQQAKLPRQCSPDSITGQYQSRSNTTYTMNILPHKVDASERVPSVPAATVVARRAETAMAMILNCMIE